MFNHRRTSVQDDWIPSRRLEDAENVRRHADDAPPRGISLPLPLPLLLSLFLAPSLTHSLTHSPLPYMSSYVHPVPIHVLINAPRSHTCLYRYTPLPYMSLWIHPRADSKTLITASEDITMMIHDVGSVSFSRFTGEPRS